MIAIVLLSIVEVVGYRKQLVNNVATLAQVTAVNATAATVFQDPAAAHTLVSSLSSEPAIDYARVFTASGLLLASHEARVETSTANTQPNTPTIAAITEQHGAAFGDQRMFDAKTTQTAFHRDHLDAIAPIRLDGEVIGYV